MITASDWRPIGRNTLRGFCDLRLQPSGIMLHECSLHEKGGKRWIGLPAGKAERERFQAAALAAVDRLLGTQSGNGTAKFHPIAGEIIP